MMSEPTSQSLLVRLKADEPQAWQRMVDLYGALIYYWCRRDGLSPEDAADVSQEVFYSVMRGISRFRHDGQSGSFRGWLRTITKHKICDQQRRAARRETATGGSDAKLCLQNVAEEAPPSTKEQPPVDPLETILTPARERFQANTWRAFWRTTVEQQAPADVAEELGMSVAAVYMARSRILRSLRDEFGETLPSGADSSSS